MSKLLLRVSCGVRSATSAPFRCNSAAAVKQHLRTVNKSETLFINEQSGNLAEQGHDIFRFGFGQSPFLPPQVVMDALAAHTHHKEYTAVSGAAPLRSAIANFHDWDANGVLVAPGSKLLLYATMAAFQPGLNVLLVTPSWVSYAPQAALAGHKVTRVSTTFEDRWRITPASLDEAIRATGKDKHAPALMVLNYPGNPDGLTYTRDELAALAPVMRENNIIVLSDEIYGLLQFDGGHASLAESYPEGTIVTTGLSKWCGAGGWRLGVALFPPELEALQRGVEGVASETYSSAPAPVQYAAISAYGSDTRSEINQYLDLQRRILSAIGNHVATKLNAAGIHVHAPTGGFYVSPDFSALASTLAKEEITTSPQLCARILQDTGVALLPGDAFGWPQEHLVARLAFVDFDGATAVERAGAQAVDSSFVRRHCPRVVEGIQRLCDWTEPYV